MHNALQTAYAPGKRMLRLEAGDLQTKGWLLLTSSPTNRYKA